MKWKELTLKQISDCCEYHKCDDCPLDRLCHDEEGHMSLANVNLEDEIDIPKWVCDMCHKTFYDPDTKSEHVGEFWGQPAYENHSVCPYCGSEEIIYEEDIFNDYL